MSRFLRLFGLFAIAVLAIGASEGVPTGEPVDDPIPETSGMVSEATALPCEADGCDACEGEECDDADVDWGLAKIRDRCGNSGGWVSVCCDGNAVEMCNEITCFH